MDYECQSVPIDKLIINADGQIKPLCDTCFAPDCTNPIKEHTVYVMGVPQKLRLWVVNNSIRQVVSCLGYVGNIEEDDSDANL